MKVENIDINKIYPPEERMRHLIGGEEINELAESIRQVGLLQPIVVSKGDGKYTIIAGERRYMAMKELDMKSIPCVIVEDKETPQEIMQIVENIQRVETTPLEEADVVLKLKRKYGLSSHKIAELLGKSDGWVSQRMATERWEPELREAVQTGDITFTVAREIDAVKDPEVRMELLNDAIQYNLSIDDVILRKRIIDGIAEQGVGSSYEDQDTEGESITEKYHSRLNRVSCVVCSSTPGIQYVSWQPVCQMCLKRILEK